MRSRILLATLLMLTAISALAQEGPEAAVYGFRATNEVKQIIKDIIESEDKDKPYSDDKLEKILNDKGYNIARRTVAKYREQLNIPVARLRKEM